VRSLILPMICRSESGHSVTVEAGTTGEGAALASVRSFGVSQPATVVGDTTGDGAALVTVRLVGVITASHGGCGLDRRGRCPGFCFLGRRGLNQPLCWRERQVRALPCPVSSLSA
jgi:hypothetical protein